MPEQREKLTEQQQRAYDFIREKVAEQGYPPSVREIGKAIGLSSPSSVHAHIEYLERKGYIKKDPTKPRTIEIIDDIENEAKVIKDLEHKVDFVPIIGTVTAGEPILAVQNVEDYFPVPAIRCHDIPHFMLRVHGESMIKAGIFDGDMVLVEQTTTAENGDIVVALLGDSATVKRFYKENGYYRLQPENDTMDPIIVSEVSIIGKVIGSYRSF